MYVLRFFVGVLLLLLFVCFFFFFLFVLLFFLLQNAPIAMIFDDAIYRFIYSLHFISMLLRPSPILKTSQKMGERNKKKL